MEKKFQSGFVTVIGRPNVGKSTLINYISGEKIAITSPKPQTTRKNQLAIITEKNYQIVFVDTPGLHSPKNKLGEFMMATADEAMVSTDIIMYLYDSTEDIVSEANRVIIEKISGEKSPKILVLTKVDLIEKEKLLPLIQTLNGMCDFKSIIPISALEKDGLKDIIDEILKILPEGPLYYPDDISTVSTVRELSEDIIREKILYFTHDELPHGCGVEIIKFIEPKKRGQTCTIEATIYCEKESHKGMLIGKGGEMLKKIGTYARRDIEKLYGGQVNLQLWVKVKEDWRNSPSMLKTLGYETEKRKNR